MPLLRPHLPHLELVPFAAFWREGFPSSPGLRWISTRFHPHLLAAARGSQGIAIPIGSDYSRTKHHALTQLGSGWSVAAHLQDPIEIGPAPSKPYGGRLTAIKEVKMNVARQVTSLLPR